MRIERLRVPAFGPLRDIDTGPSELPGFVAVTGPNESGKSSLLEAIRTLLYGIYPAGRDGHPHAPWDGTDGEVEGWLRTAEGDRLRVHRRILATPWGRLEQGGSESDLRNRNAPPVAHVPLEIYRQVHAISLPELMRLQRGNAWESLRDRIMAGMGTRDLAPPRRVAGELAREADALWRTDRRGRPREVQLAERVRELSRRLGEAREADRRFREADDAREAAEASLVQLRIEQASLRERVRVAREYVPLKERIEHLDRLEAEAGDPADFEGLPSDPGARLEALEGGHREASLGAERALETLERLREEVPDPDPGDAAILAHADAIEGLRALVAVGDEAAGRARGLESELERADAEVTDLSAPVIEDGTAPGAGELTLDTRALTRALGRIDFDHLRALLVRQGLARSRLDEVEARLAEPPPATLSEDPHPPTAKPPVTRVLFLVGGLLLSGIGAVMFATGTGDDIVRWIALGLGVSALVAALTLHLIHRAGVEAEKRSMAAWRRRLEEERRQASEARAHLEAREALHRTELIEATEAVAAVLADIPVREARIRAGGEGLATALERLGDALRRRNRIRSALETERSRVEAADQAVETAAQRAGIADPAPHPTGDERLPSTGLMRLLDLVRGARVRSEVREAARARVADAEAALEAARERAERSSEELEAFRQALRYAACGPDAAQGSAADGAPDPLGRVMNRIEADAEARRLRRELEGRHGALPELRERIRLALEDPGSTGDAELAGEALARAEARLEALGDRIQQAVGAVEASRVTLEAMEGTPTVDLVESELAELQVEREELRRQRDRLWLLSRLTGVAERRFRESHQPELVRRAGEILGALTGGRYDTLLLGDDENPDLLQVRATHLPSALPVEHPLSTGTREQIWFALRMGVVELVEGGGEVLPLVLDEVFVNWDAERRGAALDALARMAERRQVFLVTCHPRFADEAAGRGARRIELVGPAA